MIKLSELKKNQGRIVRETTFPFIVSDADGERTEQLRVRYFSLSIAESRAFRETIRDRENDLYLSDILLPIIDSLPDITDDKDKPVKVTADVLESLNTINLRAMQKAIEEHLTGPKTQPSR